MKEQLIEILLDVLRQTAVYACESFINAIFQSLFA